MSTISSPHSKGSSDAAAKCCAESRCTALLYKRQSAFLRNKDIFHESTHFQVCECILLTRNSYQEQILPSTSFFLFFTKYFISNCFRNRVQESVIHTCNPFSWFGIKRWQPWVELTDCFQFLGDWELHLALLFSTYCIINLYMTKTALLQWNGKMNFAGWPRTMLVSGVQPRKFVHVAALMLPSPPPKRERALWPRNIR